MMMDLAGVTDLSISASPRPNHVPHSHGQHAYRPLDEMGHEQKTRLPNWTEEEKNVLIQEVRRRAAVLTTPRAKGMSHLKEKAWEEITAAVNAVQAPGSQLRNAQTCRKKWENLKLYAKKAQKEGRSDVTLSTVSQLIGSDVDLKVLQATLQAVQGAASPSPSPGPIESGPESLGAILSVLQQQGMNGALARMLGISENAPAPSDEASLSDCSNSVEDSEEIKTEIVEESRRMNDLRNTDGLMSFQDMVKQSSSPLPLPPGVSLEPVQKMTVSSIGKTPPPVSHGHNPQAGSMNGIHYSHQRLQHHHQQQQQRSSQSPGMNIHSNGVSRIHQSPRTHQSNSLTRVNGRKRRRGEDDSESDDYYLDKRLFYKEVTKLCGTAQILLQSVNETQQLQQQVLLEKLRLIRLKATSQENANQRNSTVHANPVSETEHGDIVDDDVQKKNGHVDDDVERLLNEANNKQTHSPDPDD